MSPRCLVRCLMLPQRSCGSHFQWLQKLLCTSTLGPKTLKDHIFEETKVSQEHLTPELSLHLITPTCSLWSAPPDLAPFPDPFWAFYWPGGQALSRYVLDNPELVREKVVLDFGCGCGASGLAAKKVGARQVTFNDIDEVAIEAVHLNASKNQIPVDTVTMSNLVGTAGLFHQVILAGDLLYDSEFAGEVLSWLLEAHRSGSLVLIGDPGRFALQSHPLRASLRCLAKYELSHTAILENNGHPRALVWTFR